MPLYESSRALNEIESSRITQTVTTFGLSWILAGEFSRTVEPGFSHNVDHALRWARRRRRTILTNPWEAIHRGQLLDIRVRDLNVGVMPFLRFADVEPGRHISIAAFLARATVSPFQPTGRGDDDLHIVLLGNLDNVTRPRWQLPDVVGHEFPSDPSFLSSIIAHELALSGPMVRKHILDYEEVHNLDRGDRATFAWQQTERAGKSRSTSGTPSTWVWDTLHTARVVAITEDIQPEPHDEPGRILLARPVLIHDMT